MRILAVDPGLKRLGLALSDPTGTIARPLMILSHVSRVVDAIAVARQAEFNEAGMIVVGQSLDEDGQPTLEGRHSARFVVTLRMQTNIPVILWDEAFTTQDARAIRLAQGVSRRRRSGHLDDVAAAIQLQSYLDTQHKM